MASVREYIEARIAVEDRGYTSPCWVWQLSLQGGGYGQGLLPGRSRVTRMHRAAYEEFVGPIPKGLHLDHLCRVRECCNPSHLEPVTVAENVRRGLCGVLRTHCKRGHKVSPENALQDHRCRECRREWGRTNWTTRDETKPIINPQTHCKKGHALTPDNVRINRGYRRCRACNVEWSAENYRKKMAATHGGRGGQPPNAQSMSLTHDGQGR